MLYNKPRSTAVRRLDRRARPSASKHAWHGHLLQAPPIPRTSTRPIAGHTRPSGEGHRLASDHRDWVGSLRPPLLDPNKHRPSRQSNQPAKIRHEQGRLETISSRARKSYRGQLGPTKHGQHQRPEENRLEEPTPERRLRAKPAT